MALFIPIPLNIDEFIVQWINSVVIVNNTSNPISFLLYLIRKHALLGVTILNISSTPKCSQHGHVWHILEFDVFSVRLAHDVENNLIYNNELRKMETLQHKSTEVSLWDRLARECLKNREKLFLIDYRTYKKKHSLRRDVVEQRDGRTTNGRTTYGRKTR